MIMFSRWWQSLWAVLVWGVWHAVGCLRHQMAIAWLVLALGAVFRGRAGGGAGVVVAGWFLGV